MEGCFCWECMTALAGLGLVACGGGSSSGGGSNGGTATVLMGTAPDYLDPQEEYTTQGAEPNWISYTPLVTYKHENAPGGNELIPGLATALPQISQDQKTYTLTLRKGLVFSNGQPVKASDFKCTVERMIKVNWGGKSFVTDNVDGRDRLRRGQGQRHLGHHDRRRHRARSPSSSTSPTARSRTCWRSPSWVWSRAARRIAPSPRTHAPGRRRRT